MPKKDAKPTRFFEDGFDLEKAKKGLNNVAKEKARNKRLHIILKILKFLIMLASFGLFLLLFFLAMEIITQF
ncbi:MAG: hypothetical protein FWB88_06470 [Defluviitaleaceae bacterium]|nr:hypothetical protein [Defluviitaleaceae bacterium]MCL2239180.1 hypothetical protein [Defluviitaleaceae bacterium]